MHNWLIKDPILFYAPAGALIAYILYIMIRRRKGERRGQAKTDPEL
jgi:hypothetical protein